MSLECVFCGIASGNIPVQPVYRNEEFMAFADLNPQAPVHVLVIPLKHFTSLMDVEDVSYLGRAMDAVREVVRILEVDEFGFRVVVNTGNNGGQTVPHLHFQILGGRVMTWPPG